MREPGDILVEYWTRQGIQYPDDVDEQAEAVIETIQLAGGELGLDIASEMLYDDYWYENRDDNDRLVREIWECYQNSPI